MRKIAILLGLLFAPVSSAMAQETRIAEEGQESPAATLAEMEWLVGQWAGTGIGGSPAVESWLPATGPIMVGTFIQQTSDGGIQFTEHMYLMEEEGSLVLRLKHFNADLTAWEDKEGMVSFRLLELEHCAAYFHALTLRCEYLDDGTRILVVAVRMSPGDELLFRFRKASIRVTRTGCSHILLTNELNGCVAELYSKADQRRKRYARTAINEALKEEYHSKEALRLFAESEAAFEAYREKECSAIYEEYKDGTIRDYLRFSCLIDLTNYRTHMIWSNWIYQLTGETATLPEPAFID